MQVPTHPSEITSVTMTLKREILTLITEITKSCAAKEQSKSLLSVAATRWNSFFLVCDRLIDGKEHVIVVCNSKDSRNKFSWSEELFATCFSPLLRWNTKKLMFNKHRSRIYVALASVPSENAYCTKGLATF